MTTSYRETWMTYPSNRDTFRQIDIFLDTARIGTSEGTVLELSDATGLLDWDVLTVPDAAGAQASLDRFLKQSDTDAFIVLRGREVLYERYFGGNTAESRHIAMSVSKSFCGMLAGILAGDGLLDVGAPVTDYVPELAGSAYDGATVREVLDMTAAPSFDMRYLGAETEVQLGDRCAGWRPRRGDEPGGTHEFLASLQGHGAHGERFQYCSATTDVLAWALERATGVPYARLMQDRLWSRMGAKADALITVDEFGMPYACAGMAMRLRDLARFGLLIQARGTHAGKQVIPADWIEDTRAGGAFDASEGTHRNVTYRNQWWVPQDGSAGFYAAGIFGQYLWIHPEHDIVIAKFSSTTHPVESLPEQEAVFPIIAAFAAAQYPATTGALA